MNDLSADTVSDLLCYGWRPSLLTNMNDLLALTLLWWQSPWTWTQTTVCLFHLTFSVLFFGLSPVGQILWIIFLSQWLPVANRSIHICWKYFWISPWMKYPLVTICSRAPCFPVRRIGFDLFPSFPFRHSPDCGPCRPSYSGEPPSTGQW